VAKGRVDVAIAEMRRKKDLPRTLASVDGSIRGGVIVDNEKGTALLNKSARVEVTTIPPIITIFKDPIPCSMDLCGDTGDEDELSGDNEVQVGLPPARGAGVQESMAAPNYITVEETDEITIEVDEEEAIAEKKIGIIAKALEEFGRQAGLVNSPAIQLGSNEGEKGQGPMDETTVNPRLNLEETGTPASGRRTPVIGGGGVSMLDRGASAPEGGRGVSASDGGASTPRGVDGCCTIRQQPLEVHLH